MKLHPKKLRKRVVQNTNLNPQCEPKQEAHRPETGPGEHGLGLWAPGVLGASDCFHLWGNLKKTQRFEKTWDFSFF